MTPTTVMPATVPPGCPRRLVVVGTGLIGTSVALAARGLGAAVWLADRNPAVARFAAGLGAGDELPAAGPPGGPADLAVLAMPPAAVAPALAAAQQRGLARRYTDVAIVIFFFNDPATTEIYTLSLLVAGPP